MACETHSPPRFQSNENIVRTISIHTHTHIHDLCKATVWRNQVRMGFVTLIRKKKVVIKYDSLFLDDNGCSLTPFIRHIEFFSSNEHQSRTNVAIIMLAS